MRSRFKTTGHSCLQRAHGHSHLAESQIPSKSLITATLIESSSRTFKVRETGLSFQAGGTLLLGPKHVSFANLESGGKCEFKSS